MSSDIFTLWNRIHDFIDARYPRMATSFNAPAQDEEIEVLEASIGLSLPADFRASLKVHNGQNDPYRLLGLSLDGILMDTKAIAKAWELTNKVDQHFWRTDPEWGTIEWWNPKWVPFIDNQSGDYLCINMDRVLFPPGTLVYHVHDNPFHDALGQFHSLARRHRFQA